MATHSSILAWRIPGMGEPGGLPSVGSQDSDTTEPRRAVCGTRGSLRTMHGGGSAPSCCAFPLRVAFEEGSGHDEDLREPLVRRQGSQVSMRVARASASWLSSRGRGLGPRDALKKAFSLSPYFCYMAKLVVNLCIFGDTVLSPTHLSSFPIHFHSIGVHRVGLNYWRQQILLILIDLQVQRLF